MDWNDSEEVKKYNREWRAKNKERIRARRAVYFPEYFEKNKEIIKEQEKAYRDTRKDHKRTYDQNYKFTVNGKYRALKASAKTRELELDLSKQQYEEFFYEKPCFYCGRISGGIDRVDSDKGYVAGNMLPLLFLL